MGTLHAAGRSARGDTPFKYGALVLSEPGQDAVRGQPVFRHRPLSRDRAVRVLHEHPSSSTENALYQPQGPRPGSHTSGSQYGPAPAGMYAVACCCAARVERDVEHIVPMADGEGGRGDDTAVWTVGAPPVEV